MRTVNSASYKLIERPIYGSSRVGIDNTPLEFIGYTAPTSGIYTHLLGLKQYELVNHLGNVLTTVSDKKIPVDLDNSGTIDYYVADITSATDYYPFGSPMDGRAFSGEKYRFGFNGKEKDDELKGEGNSLDFGARIYDSRLGRFLSIDIMAKKNSGISTYSAFVNNPILYIDPSGNDTLIVHRSKDNSIDGDGITKIYILTFSVVRDGIETTLNQKMYMMSNAKSEDREGNNHKDNDLHLKRFYKMVQKQMVGFEKQGRQIKVTNYGNFIHPVMDVGWIGGCFGVSNLPPVRINGKLVFPFSGDKIYEGKFVDDFTKKFGYDFKSIEGGIYTMFRLYNEANSVSALTGDKWLLKPNSTATKSPSNETNSSEGASSGSSNSGSTTPSASSSSDPTKKE